MNIAIRCSPAIKDAAFCICRFKTALGARIAAATSPRGVTREGEFHSRTGERAAYGNSIGGVAGDDRRRGGAGETIIYAAQNMA